MTEDPKTLEELRAWMGPQVETARRRFTADAYLAVNHVIDVIPIAAKGIGEMSVDEAKGFLAQEFRRALGLS